MLRVRLLGPTEVERDGETVPPPASRRAWALLGSVAEPAASVRERRDGDSIVFEVVTGMPDNAGPFTSHGHTLKLTLTPA